MAKKVLITGAAGFIGSNLSHFLAQERPDWDLYLLDSLTYAGNLENINELLEKDNIVFLKEDIVNEESLLSLFKKEKFDIVFHLAAESHVDRSIHSATEFVLTNVVGTQNLVSAAREVRVEKFVHVSTDEVYGALGETGQFMETTPLDPTSPYSASKASSDLLVLANCKTHDFPGVVTRCSNNYGPYQFPEKLIPLFVTNAMEDKSLPIYGDGKQVRHWVYVTDHCEALLQVAENAKNGEVYNIAGPKDAEITNVEVTKGILDCLDKPESLIKPVEDRLAHDRRYSVDISKIKQDLGWEPKINFNEGLKETVNWYVNNEDWWTKIKSGEYMDFYEKHYGVA